jgi:outer membrane protein
MTTPCRFDSCRRGLALIAALLASTSCFADMPRVRVGVITDGPTDRDMFPVETIAGEVPNVIATQLQIEFPRDKRHSGDWSRSGVDAALDRALADPQIDVVLALGVLASHQAARRTHLTKPVIAPVVADPMLQGFPLTGGNSGRANFAYIADFEGVSDNVRTFHEVVGFRHLAALVDESLLRSVPQLQTKADAIAAAMSVRISIVSTSNDAAEVLSKLPADADAVYVTGLQRFSAGELRELTTGLVARRLPSFSATGRSEVASGLLMTTGGAQRDVERLARRIVLMIQRVAQGEDPGQFEVGFATEQKLVVNMETARRIGFSPRWQDLADADRLNESAADAQPLTLVAAMQAALQLNPALAASSERVDSAADDIRIARSNLLPTLDASVAHTRIDADRASSLTQAERTASTGISLQQVIYSERAWANHSISQSLFEASKQGQRQDMLDTLESAASAYISVLRAASLEKVRRSNVENTRKNLELARVREHVGLGGRSDHLRWQAQLATDKQSLLAAESARRQAEAELARIMHRPADRPFMTVKSDVDGPLALVSSPRMRRLMETPDTWTVFTNYAVNAALEQSAELAQLDALRAGHQRSVTAAQRAYFIPDFALVSNGSKVSDRSGVGANSMPGAPDAESWSISLQISMPVFTGGRRAAELSQARHELRAVVADRTSAMDAIETRTRVALHRAASSYPSIALSNEAAQAANENLSMVSAAYARGAVSITDLIDAQEAALNADLAAADAEYGFLLDFVAVLRSMSEFELLLDPASREAWFKRVEQWFENHQSTAALRR